MATYAPTMIAVKPRAVPVASARVHWDLAFCGILAYLIIEYTRLAAMYQFLLPFRIGKIAVALSAIGLVLAPAASRRAAVLRHVRNIDVCLAVFLFTVFLSAIFAKYQDYAWDTFLMCLQWALIYFLVARIVSDTPRMRVFVFLLLLLNFKLAQFAIRSYIAGRAFGRSEAFLAGHGVGGGSTGFFGNGNDFGVAMAVIWPLAGMLFFSDLKKRSRLLLLFAVVAFLVALLLCASRGAVLAAAVTVLVAWLKNPKRLIGPALAVCFLLGFMYVLPSAYKDRLNSALDPDKDDTAQIRLNLWKAGVKMFEDNPILGVGVGNYSPVYAREYPVAALGYAEWAPHSIYIQAISELGIVGTLPLVVLVFLLFRLNAATRRHLKNLNKSPRSFEYSLAVGLNLALVGYLVSGAFITVLYYPHLWILLGLSAGLHIACRRMPQSDAAADTKVRKFAPALC